MDGQNRPVQTPAHCDKPFATVEVADFTCKTARCAKHAQLALGKLPLAGWGKEEWVDLTGIGVRLAKGLRDALKATGCFELGESGADIRVVGTVTTLDLYRKTYSFHAPPPADTPPIDILLGRSSTVSVLLGTEVDFVDAHEERFLGTRTFMMNGTSIGAGASQPQAGQGAANDSPLPSIGLDELDLAMAKGLRAATDAIVELAKTPRSTKGLAGSRNRSQRANV